MNASPNHHLDEQDVPPCGNRPLPSDAPLSATDRRPSNFYKNRNNLGVLHPPSIVHVAQQQMQVPHVPRNRPPMIQHQYPIQHQRHIGHMSPPQAPGGVTPSNYHAHSHLFPHGSKNPSSHPHNHSRHPSQNGLNHRSNPLRQVQQPVPVLSSNNSHMSHPAVIRRNHVRTHPNRQNHVRHVHSSNLHQVQVPVQLQYQHTNPRGHAHMHSNHHHPIHPHHKRPSMPYSYPMQYHTHVQPPSTKAQHHPSPQKLPVHSQQNNQHKMELLPHRILKQPRRLHYPTNNVSGQTPANSNIPYSNIRYDRSFVPKLSEGAKPYRENTQTNTTNEIQNQYSELEINSNTSDILSTPHKTELNSEINLPQRKSDISAKKSKAITENPQSVRPDDENTNDKDTESLISTSKSLQTTTTKNDSVPQSMGVNCQVFNELKNNSVTKKDDRIQSSERCSHQEQKDNDESQVFQNENDKGEVDDDADVETNLSTRVRKSPTKSAQLKGGRYAIDSNDNDANKDMKNNLSKVGEHQSNEICDSDKPNNSGIKLPELSSSNKNTAQTSDNSGQNETGNPSMNPSVTNFQTNVTADNSLENKNNNSGFLPSETKGREGGWGPSDNKMNDSMTMTSKVNVLTSKSDLYESSSKSSNDVSLSNRLKSMSPPPQIKRFYPPNYHGDHVLNMSSPQGGRAKFDALKLLTPKHVVKAMPKDASCIFYIFDRRVNFDAFPADISFYALLRAWVQDDPYRKIPPPELNLLNYMNTNAFTPLKSWSMEKTEILDQSKSLNPVCKGSKTLQNRQPVDMCSLLFQNLDEKTIEKRKDPKILLLQHVKNAKQIKKVKQRKKRKLDDLCWKRMEAIGVSRF